MSAVVFPLAAEQDPKAVLAQAGPVVEWFTANTGVFISGAIKIVVVLIIAAILRAVAGRVIEHSIKRMVTSRQRFANGRFGNGVLAKANGSKSERQEQRAQTISSVLRSVASFVIFGVAIIMVLGELGINLGPILMSAGVLGLAIGFGAQSLVQDFLSGMFMLAEDQYGVGDVVDVGEAVGTVEEVSLRITKIRDLNGGLWYVRNGEIMRVCNMNQDWANAVVDMPLDTAVDLTQVNEVLERSIEEFAARAEFADKLLERPEANGVVAIANGAMTVRVIAKTKPGEQWALGRELRAHLKRGFDREGISVAYPMMPMNSAG